MTIKVKLAQYDLPMFWAPALIYNDLSGYTEHEALTLEKFVDDMIARHGQCWCVDVGDDVWFSRWHDAAHYGVAACDVARFTFDVQKGDN